MEGATKYIAYISLDYLQHVFDDNGVNGDKRDSLSTSGWT